MDCRTAESSLSLFLDGELDSRTSLALEVHLRRCPSCQAQQAMLQKIKKCLKKKHVHVRAPDDFAVAVQSKLRRLSVAPVTRVPASPYPAQRRAIVMVSIGSTLLLAATLFAILVWTQRLSKIVDMQMAAVQKPGSAPDRTSTYARVNNGPLAGGFVLASDNTNAQSEQRPWASVAY